MISRFKDLGSPVALWEARSNAAPATAVCANNQETARREPLLNKRGMEMVQVAILVAIAVTLGLIFKEQITNFVNNTFGSLSSAKF